MNINKIIASGALDRVEHDDQCGSGYMGNGCRIRPVDNTGVCHCYARAIWAAAQAGSPLEPADGTDTITLPVGFYTNPEAQRVVDGVPLRPEVLAFARLVQDARADSKIPRRVLLGHIEALVGVLKNERETDTLATLAAIAADAMMIADNAGALSAGGE